MRIALTVLAALAFGGAVTAEAQIGDPVAGEVVFQQCKGCHQVGAGAKHRIGPHLNGLFGRRAASYEDFNYSKSFVRGTFSQSDSFRQNNSYDNAFMRMQ